jgi:hypothetical protein
MTQIEKHFRFICARAEARYGVDLSAVGLEYETEESCNMGEAVEYDDDSRAVCLNAEYLDHPAMIDEVIPHEVAHIVCQIQGIKEPSHGPLWAAVARYLGATGKPCIVPRKVFPKDIEDLFALQD